MTIEIFHLTLDRHNVQANRWHKAAQLTQRSARQLRPNITHTPAHAINGKKLEK